MTIMQRHGIGGVLTTNLQFSNGGGEAITITDSDGWVCLNVTDRPLRLSVEQARYLALCFAAAADRVEANEKTIEQGTPMTGQKTKLPHARLKDGKLEIDKPRAKLSPQAKYATINRKRIKRGKRI